MIDSRKLSLPSRAESVLLPKPIVAKSGKDELRFHPFDVIRTSILYSISSPLVSDGGKAGAGLGWMLTEYVMAYPDIPELAAGLAEGGIAWLTRKATDYFAKADSFGIVAAGAEALKKAWLELLQLDPPDGAGDGEQAGAGETEAGKSTGLETAG